MARPTKFAECHNGQIIIWTLGKDGAYHSEATGKSCSFKKDVILSNAVGRSAGGGGNTDVPKILSADDWARYYEQNKSNIQPYAPIEEASVGTATVSQGAKTSTVAVVQQAGSVTLKR